MKTTVEELIKERSFSSLTASERDEVRELCSSEEDFLRMKQFLLGVETMSNNRRTQAGTSVKSSLDDLFAKKYQGAKVVSMNTDRGIATPVIPLYRKNWVRVAAVALLIIGSAPFFLMQSDAVHKEAELAKLETPSTQDKSSIESVQTDEANKPSLGKQQTQADKSDPATYAWTFGDSGVDGGTYSVEADEVAAASVDDGEVSTISAGATTPLTTATGATTYAWTAPSTSSGFVATTTSPTVNGNFSQPKTSAAKQSFASEAKASEGRTLNRGMIADLDPSTGDQAKVTGSTVNTRSMADQPEDLFDLLVPAF